MKFKHYSFLSLLITFLFTIPKQSAAQYCNSSFSSVSWEHVTNVNYGGINNSSGGTVGGPVNYTALGPASATIGTASNLSVTILAAAAEYVFAFIDWNQNGTLNDAGEVYTVASNVSTSGPHVVSITPPATAVTGNTRMRVMLVFANSTPNPCISSYYGEAEDYTVNVRIGCASATFPSAATITASKDTVCVGKTVDLDMTTAMPSASGITYQWKSAPSANGPWTNMGAAQTTTPITTPALTNTTYYTCSVLCNGTSVLTSNVISVYAVSVNTPVTISKSRCGWGTVTLDAVPTPGITLDWYSTATGGTKFYTGNSYTTPYITSTTDYYVEATAGGSGPVVAQVGNGTSSTVYYNTGGPYNNYYRSEGTQMLYTASDLIAAGASAGDIVSIAFNCTGTPQYPLLNYTIQMKTVPASMTNLSWQNSGMTTVYNSASYSPPTGWQTYNLTSPITWNGPDGIVIYVCMNQTQPSYSTSGGTHQYTTVSGRMLTYYNDAVATSCGVVGPYSSTYLPNCKFGVESGCKSTRALVTATVTPAPPVTTSAPQTVVCTGLTASLQATSINNDYGYTWNPSGLQGANVVVTPTGTSTLYTVSAVDSVIGSPYFGCYAEDTIRINTTNGPAAVISPNILPTVCPGTPQLLSANSGTGLTYQWSFNNVPISGATGISYSATQSGTYTVTVDNGQCDSTSTPVIKADHNFPTSSLTYNSPLEFCEGSSVVLTSQFGSGLSYQWYKDGIAIPNGVDSFYEALTSGTYYVIISNGNGCLVTTNSVPVTVHPLPNPIIIRNGMLLSVPVAYSSYQWYLYNSPIPGANQSSFMMTQDGVYTVEVTNSFGCKKRAAVVVVNNTGIEVTNPIAQQIKIYPNPTSDKVKIESPIPVKILVQSSAGYEIINRSDVTSLELGQLPDGVYILSIFDEDGVIIKHEKVVKSSH